MKLTKELVRELFEYRDGYLIWRVANSNFIKVGDVAGGCRKDGYRRIFVLGKKRYAHRLIFLWHHGFVPTHIDHVDGDPTNNRIENLRAATQKQNSQNTRLRSDNTSGFKGVCWFAQRQKWKAHITINNKHQHLGNFDNPTDAAKAYDDAAFQHFGEFARLNFPRETAA